VVRLVADAVRAAAAFAATAFVWGLAHPLLATRVSGVPSEIRPLALGATLVLLAAAITALAFRLTSGRFKRPLQGRWR
jgi:hypothetical protein